METIESSCFSWGGLEEINIPGGDKSIEDRAFEHCNNLKHVTFAGEALETIGLLAFDHTGLESFTAPASLQKIEDMVFAGCEHLKHVDFSACTLQNGG